MIDTRILRWTSIGERPIWYPRTYDARAASADAGAIQNQVKLRRTGDADGRRYDESVLGRKDRLGRLAPGSRSQCISPGESPGIQLEKRGRHRCDRDLRADRRDSRATYGDHRRTCGSARRDLEVDLMRRDVEQRSGSRRAGGIRY